MNIGIDARFVGPQGTGLGKYTEKLVENLVALDKKNTYKIFLRQSNWSYLKFVAKNFTKVLADVPWYSMEEQLKMPGIYNTQNLDLLHIPHFNVPILYRGKFIVTIHDLIHHKFSQESATTKNPLIFKTKRFAYKRIIKNAVLKSTKIITPSNYVKREIVKTFGLNENKIVVTYEAAEEEYASNCKPALPAGRLETINDKQAKKESFLLYVGNTYPHKNITKLLEAILLLPKNVTLSIVCPRDVFKDRLENEILAKDLKDRVSVLPYQNVNSLTKIFAQSNAYVFPSLEEGFGIPGLNAMAAGLPLVASNIPTLKEVYGDAALYFDPKNSKDIAEKINKVISSQKLSGELSTKGKAQALKYSWQKMAKETLKVYENCIS